jgi:anti-sigma factor RsiW
VSDHIRDLLALHAAGTLGPAESRRVAVHLEECTACAAEADAWRRLADEMGRLPGARPSPALVARTREAVSALLAERAEQVWNRAAIAFLVAFAWTLVFVTWLVFDVVTGELTSLLARPVGTTAAWYLTYLVSGWLSAGAAAVLLGRRSREEGRVA